MSEVVRDASKEFWQPPATHAGPPVAGMVEACDGCGSEFMAGAGFCYVCGAAREARAVSSHKAGYFAFLGFLEFHRLKHGLGLSEASLVAFCIGIGCLLAVFAVSMIYGAQNLADFQAIQSYRIQWLLAAVAAFVAGILLKKSTSSKD